MEIVVCLPTERVGVLKNLFKRVLAFQKEWGFGSVSFRGEGKTVVPRANERPNSQFNPHMVSTPGYEPGPHWWEANALRTAPIQVAADNDKDNGNHDVDHDDDNDDDVNVDVNDNVNGNDDDDDNVISHDR